MALFANDKMAAPDIYNPPPELAEGVRAITNSVESGAITQEEGNELIAYLHSAWMGAAVSNMVTDNLDRAIALSFPEAAQSGAADLGAGNGGVRSRGRARRFGRSARVPQKVSVRLLVRRLDRRRWGDGPVRAHGQPRYGDPDSHSRGWFSGRARRRSDFWRLARAGISPLEGGSVNARRLLDSRFRGNDGGERAGMAGKTSGITGMRGRRTDPITRNQV